MQIVWHMQLGMIGSKDFGVWKSLTKHKFLYMYLHKLKNKNIIFLTITLMSRIFIEALIDDLFIFF